MLLLLCNLTNFLLQKSFLNPKFLSRNPVSQSGAPQDVNNKCDKKKKYSKSKDIPLSILYNCEYIYKRKLLM